MLAPALANADTSSTLTVVGTSDVSDSGLMPNLIMPAFQAAFPAYAMHYAGSATGVAISAAETGSGGPSVLIVHAASLENQFVAGGFSFEPYGRAIFINDFVLAGPTGDPAGVGSNAPHNIAQAFADIATAGINGGGTPKAEFVSRGGGAAGTSVAEHAIWALVDAMPSPPAGLILCSLSAANGGGDAPIAAGHGVTQATPAQACPSSGAVPSRTSGTLPAWYDATGATQGPNVQDADACNGYPSGNHTCYVFTDRGTFDYLSSGTDPAGAIPNLTILTRNNSASAPGGADELINYFHAYIIKPATFETVNLPAAQAFVNFLTSPALQAQLKTYLAATADPGGPPFVADASPIITDTGIPTVSTAGAKVTVSGSVTNAEPGYPPLANQPVAIDEIEGGLSVPVAKGTTSATGSYSIPFVPANSGSYQVSTGQIAQIENSTLSPVFGDLLSPAAAAAVPLSVQGTVSIVGAKTSLTGAAVSGVVGPAAPDAHATVTISARPQGRLAAFNKIGTATLKAGQTSYAITSALKAGRWQLEASYQDSGQLLNGTAFRNVTVPSAPKSTVSFTKVTVKRGALTITGALSRAPVARGAKVVLFAERTVKVKVTGTKAKKAAVAFRQVAKTSIGTGKRKFTIKVKLTRGYRWVLQLEFVPKGQKSTRSKLRRVDVR
jgi:tungstate transport system substrate-binding protein